MPSPATPHRVTLSLGLLLSALGSGGCAGRPPPAISYDRATAPGYEWPPRALTGEPRQVGHARQAQSPRFAKSESHQLLDVSEPTYATYAPSDATGCLKTLGNLDIDFAPIEELRGVTEPVEIRSPLGGVRYYRTGGGPLQLDCRMALALERIGPVLAAHGVSRARYSGAYVYKTTRSGRLSHHAHGLAIDLHDFDVEGQRLTVKQDFTRGAGCGPRVPKLNRLSCDLKRTRLFDEFLTPDFNADHYDHLHISIERLGSAPLRR